MKKTLVAVAVLGVFAGSALAADVTIYGKVDLGLQYQNTNTDIFTVYEVTDHIGYGDITNIKDDKWGLKSGSNTGSRLGIKGSEQISENLTIGFQLEHGFEADSGDFSDKDRMFNRESRLWARMAFGEIGMGRMGSLDSGLGSYNLMGDASVFGTGWGDTIGTESAVFLGLGTRMDNTITYKSPTFAGVTVYAQASLGSGDEEGSSDADRYYGLGAQGQWDALSAALTVSTTDYKREFANASGEDSSLVVSGYAAYDFGVVKSTLGVQYYDNVKNNPVTYEFATPEIAEGEEAKAWAEVVASSMIKGYGVLLGAEAPIAGGTLLASVGYADYEVVQDAAIEGDTFSFGVGYQYPLSKRTYLYAGAGYTKTSVDVGSIFGLESKTIEVVSDLVHNF